MKTEREEENPTWWFVFNDGRLLLQAEGTDGWRVPCSARPPLPMAEGQYVAELPEIDGRRARAYAGAEALPSARGWTWMGLRATYDVLPETLYLRAGKGAELVFWDAETRYCSRCGAALVASGPISKKCPHCGREAWPQLSTAIIVLVRRGRDEALLVRARNFVGDFRGLVAGFVETGETLEDCVRREVMEETGLSIRSLRYFASQPWPYPLGLMCGFTARYAGGEISLQKSELVDGGWYRRDHLPVIPSKLSMARQLLDAWVDGRFDGEDY